MKFTWLLFSLLKGSGCLVSLGFGFAVACQLRLIETQGLSRSIFDLLRYGVILLLKLAFHLMKSSNYQIKFLNRIQHNNLALTFGQKAPKIKSQ